MNPLSDLSPATRRTLARLIRAGLWDSFTSPTLPGRQGVAEELRQALERVVELAPESTSQTAAALAGAWAAAVETGDPLPLLRLVDADAPPAPEPLDVSVLVPPGAAPADLVVVYRRTMGPDRDVVVRPQLAGPAPGEQEATLRLTDWPPDEAFNHLPADMGGPYRFAVGFIATLDADGAPEAWAPDVRVLALDGPFPVEASADGGPGGLRAFVDEHTPPREEISAEELEDHLVALASFRAGLRLATVVRPTRSLLGVAPRGADAGPARLQAAPWPPETF